MLTRLIVDFNRWRDPSQGPEGRVGRGHRWLLAFGLAPLLVVGWFAYRHAGSGFMPKTDEGGFVLDFRSAALAIGAGSGMQQPLAVAIIFGLLAQFPLVLLAMPVLIGLTVPREDRAPEGAAGSVPTAR